MSEDFEEDPAPYEDSDFEWNDVIPVKQYTDPPTVLNIKYEPKIEKCMDYFRAIWNSEEVSERAFELSQHVIDILPGNFSAWVLRRKCIEKLDYSPALELAFIEEEIEDNEKCYQIWEHRRWVVEKYKLFDEEIDFIDKQLAKDNKNYHAWSYRTWLCEHFDLFLSEKIAIENYFKEDVMNNSAWNYRYFLVSKRFMLSKVDQENEIKWVLSKIREKVQNEASWNYLQGWFPFFDFINGKVPQNEKNKLEFKDFPDIETTCYDLLAKDENQSNRYLLFFMLNFYLINGKEKGLIENTLSKLSEIDPLRSNYYQWIQEQIAKYTEYPKKDEKIEISNMEEQKLQ